MSSVKWQRNELLAWKALAILSFVFLMLSLLALGYVCRHRMILLEEGFLPRMVEQGRYRAQVRAAEGSFLRAMARCVDSGSIE